MIRPAEPGDVPGLVALENASFTTDQLSAASFRHALGRGNAVLLVDEQAGALRGYAFVLFRRGSRCARLYSIAVSREHRGNQVGGTLLAAAEDAARARGQERMRLEVFEGNRPARTLYERRGYQQLGRLPDYYKDHTAALRYERQL